MKFELKTRYYNLIMLLSQRWYRYSTSGATSSLVVYQKYFKQKW